VRYDIARSISGALTAPYEVAAILSRGQRVVHPQQHNMATRELSVRLFLWEPRLPALALNEGSEHGVKQNYGFFLLRPSSASCLLFRLLLTEAVSGPRSLCCAYGER
jgi:hypothetical protein